MPDLITAAYARAHLALGPRDLDRLPGAIAGASALARNHCGRYFTRRPSLDGTLGPVDELLTPPLRGPILLAEYPVHDVFRVSVDRQPVLSVQNLDPATNQRAVARLTQQGDPIAGITPVGLYLERWTFGVKVATTVLFSGLSRPTIDRLAAAVVALGAGWTASPGGPTADPAAFGPWPTAELRPGQGAQGALDQPALFDAWTDDAPFTRDDDAGSIDLDPTASDPRDSARWGPTAAAWPGDDQLRSGPQGARIVYDAGYDPIPDDLQQAVLEIAKAFLERKSTSATVQSERTDAWTVTNREILDAIPHPDRQVLAYYRSHAR